jgi:uncharacterized protein
VNGTADFSVVKMGMISCPFFFITWREPMSESTIFFLVRIASLLLVSAFQYAVWLRMRDRLLRSGTWLYRTAAGMALLMVLPSLHIALLGTLPLPAWTVNLLAWSFLIWNAGLLALLISTVRFRTRTGKADEVERIDSSGTQFDPGRRELLKGGAAGFTILVFTNPIGNVTRDDEFEVVYKSVRIRNLPEKLKGFRIAMISDIHSGPFMSKADIEPYVTRINSLKPDVILLPGDFIQNRDEEIEVVCETFRHLRAPYGVYGSTGNHDYFADADHVSRELQLAGVNMLRNEHRIIDPNGEKLALIGIDDVRSGHPFHALFRQAARGLDPSIPNVLLCHKPYYMDEAAELGLDLMVSGHTHGGQIVLARVFNSVITPAALISGYIEGLYRLDATQMYITRGIGMVGIPIRINCPPEISILTLT